MLKLFIGVAIGYIFEPVIGTVLDMLGEKFD